MTYKSILYWPKEVHVCGKNNSSEDTHIDEAGAMAVCRALIKEGLGCNRQHFPVKAVAMSDDKIIFEWSKEYGLVTEIDNPYNYCEEQRRKLRF